MIVGTYLDLFTGEFDTIGYADYEDFVQCLKEIGKNILCISADPEVPYFINAVVEDARLKGIDWDEEEAVYLDFRGEELS